MSNLQMFTFKNKLSCFQGIQHFAGLLGRHSLLHQGGWQTNQSRGCSQGFDASKHFYL
jgi:hypothetical protein